MSGSMTMTTWSMATSGSSFMDTLRDACKRARCHVRARTLGDIMGKLMEERQNPDMSVVDLALLIESQQLEQTEDFSQKEE